MAETVNWNEKIINEFRTNDGKVGGPFEGAHLVLLTTTGAKSGRPHVSPTMYFPDGDRILVVASAAGAPNHPDWYHNLVANPRVSLEVATDSGIETYDATAEPITGDERDRRYAQIVEAAPGFGEYQQKTTRVIPIIALTKAV